MAVSYGPTAVVDGEGARLRRIGLDERMFGFLRR